MKKRNWVIGSLLAATVLTAGATGVAQACGGPGGFHHGAGMMSMHADRMDRMMDRLELNDAQRQSIEKIVGSQRDQMRTTRKSMQDIRKALRDQVSADNYDPAKVRQLADAKAKLMADMTVQRTETMHQIRQQLTPEQLATLNKMQQRKMGPGRF